MQASKQIKKPCLFRFFHIFSCTNVVRVLSFYYICSEIVDRFEHFADEKTRHNMKQIFAIASLIAMLMTAVAATGQKAHKSNGKTLEVSFEYQRQAGPGSNQYAVWVENDKGEVVKTLFVTSYTTKGRARGDQQPRRGYLVRPACVPTWVKAAKADELSDEELDAFTGATPHSGGLQTFVWDFTDAKGKPVAKGNYKVFVEATLYGASSITYSGSFSTQDKAGNIALTSQLTEPDEKHKDMVSGVRAKLY